MLVLFDPPRISDSSSAYAIAISDTASDGLPAPAVFSVSASSVFLAAAFAASKPSSVWIELFVLVDVCDCAPLNCRQLFMEVWRYVGSIKC